MTCLPGNSADFDKSDHYRQPKVFFPLSKTFAEQSLLISLKLVHCKKTLDNPFSPEIKIKQKAFRGRAVEDSAEEWMQQTKL